MAMAPQSWCKQMMWSKCIPRQTTESAQDPCNKWMLVQRSVLEIHTSGNDWGRFPMTVTGETRQNDCWSHKLVIFPRNRHHTGILAGKTTVCQQEEQSQDTLHQHFAFHHLQDQICIVPEGLLPKCPDCGIQAGHATLRCNSKCCQQGKMRKCFQESKLQAI